MCGDNVLVLGQCGSPTTCSHATERMCTYKRSCTLAPGHVLYDDHSSISLDEITPTPAERCRRNCERICSGKNRRLRSEWSGCKAFTSLLENPNSNYCQCWGYRSKPDFDEGDYLSGWFEEQTS